MTLATNTIGCAYLTYQLLPLLAASRTARIVILTATIVGASSAKAIAARLADVGGCKDTPSNFAAYTDSKVLVSLWGQALQIALRANPATAHVLVASCDPGPVNTSIVSKTKSSCLTSFLSVVVSLVGVAPAKGAVPVIFCATSPEVAAHGGTVWAQGPNVKLMKLKPYFNDENRDATFAAINAAIRKAGRAAL